MASHHGSRQRFDFGKIRVLVVDDTQASLDLIGQVLLGFGVWQTRLCRTVKEAHEKLALERFDLIIADAEMPDACGFDLTRELRARPENLNFTVPIVIASGHTPRDKVARARDEGANLVILKPIVPGVLLSRIEWLAKSKRQFVQSPGYIGPDRRAQKMSPPEGQERRAETLQLIAQPERAMSQNEIDSLFD